MKMFAAALPLTSLTFVLLLLFSLIESKQKDFYTFKVVNSRGKLVSLEKYRGSLCCGSVCLQPAQDVPAAVAPAAPAAYVAGGLQLQQLRRFFSNQVSLVVNVASECGFTDEHYRDLQQLQRDFGPFHFNVLAFPCNQFGQQEPGSDKEIDSFVRRVYGVSFPLFSKIAVVGMGANNVYKHLAEVSGKEPDWNFWKYLVDVNGKVVDAWGPKVSVKEIRPKIAEMVRQIILKKKEEL